MAKFYTERFTKQIVGTFHFTPGNKFIGRINAAIPRKRYKMKEKS